VRSQGDRFRSIVIARQRFAFDGSARRDISMSLRRRGTGWRNCDREIPDSTGYL